MKRTATVIALAAVAALQIGCARRWAGDESARIDAAMAPERWSSSVPGAGGIAVYSAAPLAAPWREGEGYQLRSERHGKRRIRAADRTPSRVERDADAPSARERRSRGGGHRSVAAKRRR